MNWPYELQIGWRYVRSGRGGRRNRFISFISGVSMLGIALGVAALIIVLSVMNGFQKEVRDRMLSVISHVEVFDAQGAALPDWQAPNDHPSSATSVSASPSTPSNLMKPAVLAMAGAATSRTAVAAAAMVAAALPR